MITGFLNLKGGVGKSKLNAYFSNYLSHYGKSVILVDCDVNQHTTEIYSNLIESDNEMFKVVNYDFSYGNVADFILSVSESYDYVLVDIPGTIQQEGVLEVIAIMDKIVIPTTNEDEDIHSTLKFIEYLDKLDSNYKVLLNNYEVQFFGMKEEEEKKFPSYREIFGDCLLEKGIRKERSLLQKNFAIGEYGNHPNSKRVEETLDLVLNFLNN